ncbi:MAG: CBS domain-containing protein [Acidobacteria bacterium]|nr:CBS domain-containing protein [Acidobacteriota bacterium]
MKVEKIMTDNVGTCRLDDNLGKAVFIMWQRDCGAVPIVDDENKVVGMVTDRDASIAAASRNMLVSDIGVKDFAVGKLISCGRKDKVEDALKKMARHKIKRLPVVNKNGELKGIISIADVLRLKKKKSVKKELSRTLEAISKPASIKLREI